MKAMRFLVAIVLLTSTGYFKAQACTCGIFPPDFFSSLQSAFVSPYDSVHVVKAIKVGVVHGYGTTFKVERYYCGNTSRDTVIVWGNPGASCRLSLQGTGLPIGDTLMLILRKNYGVSGPNESPDDFTVFYCGHHSLKVKRDSVFGGDPFSFTFKGYPLPLFEDSLCRFLGGCATTAIPDHPQAESSGARLSPNPARGLVNLSTKIR